MEKTSAGESIEVIVEGALSADGLDDLVIEYAQVGLDRLIDTDVVSEIPVVKSIVGVIRAGIAVRDRLFARKLLDFLSGFRGVSDWARRDMVSRLEADPGYGRRVGEHLTELLDRIESARKPYMVARVFRAYAGKQIDARTLHRLSYTIERLRFYAILDVRPFAAKNADEPNTFAAGVLLDFVNAGLAYTSSAYGGMVYIPTDICGDFLRLDLDKEPSSPAA